MKILCSILCIFMLNSGCDKRTDSNNSIAGSYIGIFKRSGMNTSKIYIRFTETGFEGGSDRSKYPAICRGSFRQEESTLTFIDSCQWSADFDRTFILKGEYKYTIHNDGTIRIWRQNGILKDEYLLMEETKS
jgi:hypothetical protein